MARRQKTSADTAGDGQQGKDKDKDAEPSKLDAAQAGEHRDGKPQDDAKTQPLAARADAKQPPAPAEPKPEPATRADAKQPPAPAEPKTEPATRADAKQSPAPAEPKSEPAARADSQELPAIEPPEPKTEPWPDATPAPMKPVEAAARVADGPAEVHTSRTPTETMAMSPLTDLGGPPAMPQSTAPAPLALGDVETPAHMPGPKDVPAGNPDDPAPAPGLTPPGDSRSFRCGNRFALVYRVGTCVISRTGVVGTRGQWRVVEYPTSASASNSYAHECSRFVSEGFSDYRD